MAKGAYIGVDSEYYPAFADNTWAQIIKACQKNEVPSSWTVGDQKPMTINGKDYPIDIIGIKHDTYADGSGTAPLTFQMHDIYASSYAMNSSNTNSGGWESTAVRTTRLPAILALMPSEVQAGIKEVNKVTGQGGSSFALETTADKLFILSVNEIFGYEPSDVAKGEGSQYAYYADGNSTQKKQNGEYNYWWTRSPVANNSSGFFQVRTDGSRVSTNYPSGTYGVAFAFCFGGTSELDTEFPSLGSVARKIKKGYVGIDGKARKIKKAYIGVNGVAKLCWAGADPVFANNTWAEIIAACQANSVPADWKVGDSKTMTIGGQNYQIDIIGKNHDTYSDGSGTAPLTFQLHDVYSAKYGMNSSATNVGGWTDCDMRTTTLPAILATMPSEVQAGIKEVNKKSTKGNRSGSTATTADKLFLLANMEIFGEAGYASKGEGTQYAYYAAGNSTLKTQSGSASTWWQRSPDVSRNTTFCVVNLGGLGAATTASASHGVSFAFCF